MRYICALRLVALCTSLAALTPTLAQQPAPKLPTASPTRPAVRPAAPAGTKPAPVKAAPTPARPTSTAVKPTTAGPKPAATPARTTVPPKAGTAGAAPAKAAVAKPTTTSSSAPAAPTPAPPRPAPAAKPQPALPANMGSADPETRYRNGKTLIDQTRYELAMQELEPITAPASTFARKPEAAYLYAVAASRAKKWAEAEQMLNLLRTEYPTWPAVADAFFLQAQVSFEQSEPDNALRMLSQLPAGKLETERENMKAVYLPRIRDKAAFQTLLKTYPEDAALARAYADKLVLSGWYTEADKPVLDQLVAQYALDKTRYTPRPRAVKKSSYNVGVLLPFEFDDPSWEKQRKNQFVTDLYAGLRLAQDSLQREGRSLQLFAYDTGADTLQLKQVLALPELASMDMLIGPIYKSGSKILARYAQQHQIVCINPLSQDGELVQDNPWHYLFEPSTATQARQAAQMAFNTFTSRTAVVLYEDTKDETAFGLAYKTAYEALGGKVLALRRVNPDLEESMAAGFAGLDLKTVGHLVVASDHRKAGTYTLGQLQAQGVRVPLITYASWLENPRISLSQLDHRDVYFVFPHHIDKTAPGVRRFRQLYTQRQNLPPSVFAFTGFELLYYFGTQLHQYGPAFQTNLSASGPVSGMVFQGIGYPGGARDNQYVPLTKLERLEVEVQNPVGTR
ncbi:ABC transporter substrate-binding protein [Hymenobacter sp. BT175]|uniref:ABC transporter substrate-binding protein n=1 Tax=Hymenobacter translucens TaxID=2886507 RepID=UPI001D0DF996|nr:ABC transporter substrate-binding protein [Hymenobacter translucens]MCC2545258.1 ABC transporter substrate-binding protein [Hymenobacter translucens]